MTPVRLEPAAPRSRVKHFTTEPLRFVGMLCFIAFYLDIECLQRRINGVDKQSNLT